MTSWVTCLLPPGSDWAMSCMNQGVPELHKCNRDFSQVVPVCEVRNHIQLGSSVLFMGNNGQSDLQSEHPTQTQKSCKAGRPSCISQRSRDNYQSTIRRFPDATNDPHFTFSLEVLGKVPPRATVLATLADRLRIRYVDLP